MGDHVVELARDPFALVRHGPRVAFLALALEPGRAFLDLADVGLAFARPDAQGPDDEEGQLALDDAGDAGRQGALLDITSRNTSAAPAASSPDRVRSTR